MTQGINAFVERDEKARLLASKEQARPESQLH